MIGLQVNHKWVMRAYSVVSAPWCEELEFLSIKMPDGELTSQLQHIKVGDQIKVGNRAHGTLRPHALMPGGDLWLLATGTGLAPFMSMIRDPDTLSAWNRIHVVHSVHDRVDLAYHADLVTAFADHPVCGELHECIKDVLHYVPVVTGEGDARITDQLQSGALPVNPATDKVMVCGNMAFNKDVMAWCDLNGMQEGLMRRPGHYVVERAFVDN